MPNKTSIQLERHLKGVANHWRIDILRLVAQKPGLSVERITEMLEGHHKTISSHTLKLVQAGLLEKKYVGRAVIHSVSPYGKRLNEFLKSF